MPGTARTCAAPAAALALLAACSSPARQPPPAGAPRAEIEPLVARDAVAVDPSAVPDGLVAELAGARVVLLGEVHYVEEHQRFVAALLARLHASGFRLLVEEAMHGVAWTGEEYVMGRSAALLPQLARFDALLLAGLQAFNQGLPEADRIHFAGFDMNHWPEVFQAGAAEFQTRFGRVAELDDVLAAASDTAAYDAALQALPARLVAGRSAIEAAIGAARWALLAELAEVERRSRPLRRAFDDTAREDLIRERIQAALAAAGTAGVAVNCGMTHAQKRTLWGSVPEVVGTWLASHPEAYGGDPGRLRAVAFAGARGRRLWRFNDAAAWAFDLLAEAPENSLTRIVAERAGARLAWMPLADPLFWEKPVHADYGRDVHVLPVGLQFDGLVLYPEVSVLRSLSAP